MSLTGQRFSRISLRGLTTQRNYGADLVLLPWFVRIGTLCVCAAQVFDRRRIEYRGWFRVSFRVLVQNLYLGLWHPLVIDPVIVDARP